MTETFAQWEHIGLSSKGMRLQYYITTVARGAVEILCDVFSSVLCSALYSRSHWVNAGGWLPRESCFAKHALEQQ